MQRPLGIEITSWLMCATNALGLFLVSPGSRVFALLFMVNLSLVGAGYWVLAFYRRGRNWARWLVLFTSLMALWNVRNLIHPSGNPALTRVVPVMIALEAPLALFLLVYLNLPRPRLWFSQKGRELASSPEAR